MKMISAIFSYTPTISVWFIKVSIYLCCVLNQAIKFKLFPIVFFKFFINSGCQCSVGSSVDNIFSYFLWQLFSLTIVPFSLHKTFGYTESHVPVSFFSVHSWSPFQSTLFTLISVSIRPVLCACSEEAAIFKWEQGLSHKMGLLASGFWIS